VCASGSQSIVDGPFGSNLQRRDYLDVGLPVLKLQNIKEGFILKKNLDYVSAEKYLELIRHSFLLGDIVMTKLGDPLGISSIVSDIEKGLIVADLVRIRPESIDTKFLCMQLNSNSVKFHLNKQQKGSTRPRINLGMVRELPIVNPPGPEVRDLVNLISGFDHHISSIRELVLKNNELRSGILSQLLSGDHEIPDSYDKVMGVA
jgi:type I restriction enzyme S subunit